MSLLCCPSVSGCFINPMNTQNCFFFPPSVRYMYNTYMHLIVPILAGTSFLLLWALGPVRTGHVNFHQLDLYQKLEQNNAREV